MNVLLRTGGDELLAFGEVDEGDGHDGTPILEWDGRYFTGTGIVTPDGRRVYAERVVRQVVADSVWGNVASRNDAPPDAWKDEDDKPLPEDPEIEAAFPTRSERHDLYGEAMRLVGARYSKGGLVALVNMLLHRAESPTELREEWERQYEARIREVERERDDWRKVAEAAGLSRSKASPARLDADGTAKPLTELRGVISREVIEQGHCIAHENQIEGYVVRSASPPTCDLCLRTEPAPDASHTDGERTRPVHATCFAAVERERARILRVDLAMDERRHRRPDPSPDVHNAICDVALAAIVWTEARKVEIGYGGPDTAPTSVWQAKRNAEADLMKAVRAIPAGWSRERAAT